MWCRNRWTLCPGWTVCRGRRDAQERREVFQIRTTIPKDERYAAGAGGICLWEARLAAINFTDQPQSHSNRRETRLPQSCGEVANPNQSPRV